MRRFLPWLLGASLLLSACQAPAMTFPRHNGPPGQVQLLQSAYQLLLQRYVAPLDPSTLAVAADTGMRDAVAARLGATAGQHYPYGAYRGNSSDVWAELQQQYTQVAHAYPQVAPTSLTYAAIDRMTQSINDCHTSFFTPQEFQQQQAAVQGTVQFGGIGASLINRPGEAPLVGIVFANLPAAKGGLHPGDAIERVDGKSVSGLSASAVVALIRGPVGSVVHLDIQRSGVGLLHFAITRQNVSPPAIDASVLPASNGTPIADVRIYGFTPELPQQLQSVLQQLAQRHVTLWILDLRDNGGGTVDSLTQVASLFIGPRPIAIFQNRAGQTQTLTGTGAAVAAPGRLVVLVNNGTASAGEIMAAALQENHIGVVVGTRTAGCVAIGEVHPLKDGSAIEYAADRVFTPIQHRVLNGAGVTPDVTAPMTLDDLAAGRDPQLTAAATILLRGTLPASSAPAATPAPSAGGKVRPNLGAIPGS